MDFEVKRLGPEQWASLSEDAHLAIFKERRPPHMDRIDYALLAVDPSKRGVLGYVTVRELDVHSAYWQYGGAFPPIEGGIHVLRVYSSFVAIAKKNYKRITTLVENTNVSYLKLAMKLGFRIIGVRMFKGEVLCELLLDFEETNALPI